MKNSKGLKGATDAMAYCKSMYGKGGAAGKHQLVRMAKSYELGGMTDDSCMEEYTDFDGKRKRRRKSRCGKTTKTRSSGPTQSSYGRRMPGQ
jgi:hypothetical protein